MVVSYNLSIVTIAQSLTIRLQFAIECLQRLNEQGVDHLGARFSTPFMAFVQSLSSWSLLPLDKDALVLRFFKAVSRHA